MAKTMTPEEIKQKFNDELDKVEEQYHGFYSLTDNDVRRIAAHFYNLGRNDGWEEFQHRLFAEAKQRCLVP